MIPWIALSVLVLIVVFGVFFIVLKKKNPRGMNFKGFYLIGLIFAIIGAMGDNVFMWRMGILFLILSLFHRDKIGKYPKLTKKQQKAVRLGILVALVLLFVVGVVAFYYVQG